MNYFIDKILSIPDGNLNKLLDASMSQMDNLIYNRKFSDITNIIISPDIYKLNPLVLLSILVITDPYKKFQEIEDIQEHLNLAVFVINRIKFYEDAEKIIIKKYGKKKSKELLYNLK